MNDLHSSYEVYIQSYTNRAELMSLLTGNKSNETKKMKHMREMNEMDT